MKRLIVLFVLCGCVKTPTENVIDNNINHIDEVLAYSYKNIEQTKDVIYLQNELKACKSAFEDVKQTYKGEISACESKTNYWRVVSFGLFVVLCFLGFVGLKGIYN